MEHGLLGLMTPFDRLTTTPELQMMKLMLPYTPASSQRTLAFFIKFQELQNTIKYFSNFKSGGKVEAFEKKMTSPMDFIDELRPYLGEKERSSIDMMMSAFSMMDMMNNMTSSGEGQTDPMDLIKGMLDPQQQEAFEAYNTMFAAEENEQEPDVPEPPRQSKGDENNE